MLLTLAVLLVSSCGGGDSGGGGTGPISDNSQQQDSSEGALSAEQESSTQEDASQSGTGQSVQDQTGNAANEDSSENTDDQQEEGGSGSPVIGSDPDGADTSNQGGSDGVVIASGARAQALLFTGLSVPGITSESGVVDNISFVRFDRSGAQAFVNRPNVLSDSDVIAGSVNALQVVLNSQTEVQGLATGFSYSFTQDIDVASDATVFVVAATRDPGLPGDILSGDSGNALIQASPSGATALVSTNNNVQSLGEAVSINSLGGISASSEGVAFIALTSGTSSDTRLFIHNGESISTVATLSGRTENEATIDGCNIELTNIASTSMRLLDSGTLVFAATIDGGNTSSPCARSHSTVLSYTEGVYSVLIREQDPVPNASTFVFGDVQLLDVLDDGSALVRSVLLDSGTNIGTVDDIERDSVWIAKIGASPVPVYIEGETLERTDGAAILDFGNFESGVSSTFNIGLSLAPNDNVAMRVYQRTFNPTRTRVSVHAGSLRTEQPHGSLATPGASNLALLDEIYVNSEITGSSLTAATSDALLLERIEATDRLSRIGDIAVDNQGNVYFHARVIDTLSLSQKGDYIFKRDAGGQLSIVISPLDRVAVNDSDELILSSVIQSSFPLTQDELLVSLAVTDDGSLLVHDIENGTSVLVKFEN